MIKKLTAPILALAIGFLAGVAYETEQASQRFDMGAGALMTATVHSNFKYQFDVYKKLESLLEKGNEAEAKEIVKSRKSICHL